MPMCYPYVLHQIAFLPCKVNVLRAMLQLRQDPAALHADAWALKKLFSYGVRKSGADKLASGSPIRRESWLCFPPVSGQDLKEYLGNI